MKWHRYSGFEFIQGAGILPVRSVPSFYEDVWYHDFKSGQMHLAKHEMKDLIRAAQTNMRSEKAAFLVTLEEEW